MRELHWEQATWSPQGRNVTATGSLVHIMHSLPPDALDVVCCGDGGFGATTGRVCVGLSTRQQHQL